jgi:hypothetical protein
MSTDASAMQALLAQQLMARSQGGGMIGGNQQQGAQQAGAQVPNTAGAGAANTMSNAVQQAMLVRALMQQPQQPQMPPGGNATGMNAGMYPGMWQQNPLDAGQGAAAAAGVS